jgi:hypothetical protein
MRFVTFEEEPNVQERNRRPLTCDDCNESGGVLATRFTLAYAVDLLLKERQNATSRRR